MASLLGGFWAVPGSSAGPPNPDWLLRGELLGDGPADDGGDAPLRAAAAAAAAAPGVEAEAAALRSSAAPDPRCVAPEGWPAARRVALSKALGAHARRLSAAEARAQAEAALASDPGCAEAHNVLAGCAASADEALAHFRRAAELGEPLLPAPLGELRRAAAGAGGADVWSHLAARAWVRATAGAGAALRRLGRHAEALEQYELLELVVQPPAAPAAAPARGGGGGGADTFPRYAAHLPELWLRVHGAAEAVARIRAHPRRAAAAADPASAAAWALTASLALYMCGRVTGYPSAVALLHPKTPRPRDSLWSAAGVDEGGPAYAAAELLAAAGGGGDAWERALEWLDGERALPAVEAPAALDAGGAAAAAAYAAGAGDLWRAADGALPWLRRLRNTQAASAALVAEAHAILDEGARRLPLGCGMPRVAAIVQRPDGVFLDARVGPPKSLGTLMHNAAAAGAADVVRALAAAGATPVKAAPSGIKDWVQPRPGFLSGPESGPVFAPDTSATTPLWWAVQFAAGEDTVRALIEDAGDDPLAPRGTGQHVQPLNARSETPAALAVNLGCHVELAAMFRCRPSMKTMSVVSRLLGEEIRLVAALASFLVYCKMTPCQWGSPVCSTCVAKRAASRPTASHARALRVLVDAGLQADEQSTMPEVSVLRQLELQAAARADEAGRPELGGPDWRARTAGVAAGEAAMARALAADACRLMGASPNPAPRESEVRAFTMMLTQHDAFSAKGGLGAGMYGTDRNNDLLSPSFAGMNISDDTLKHVCAMFASKLAGSGVRPPVPAARAAELAAAAAVAAAAPPGARSCAACGRAEPASGPKLRRCAGCRAVFYCGVDCQRAQWPAHAAECRRLRAE